ncbi:MAG: acetyl-CoA carboxylase biotin carboxyl carrier protein [Candidatus Izimaplasma sp.]|nr:acetyl-CoA carboxylase biotin carboxyl carrier protein [Candidatus Izimaplasma bacterium]
MDLRQIKNLIEAFEESTVHKLKINNEEFSISLEKETKAISDNKTNVPPILPKEEVVQATSSEKATPEKNTNTLIKAPLVGTFYAAPSPDSTPYVQVGDKVKEGETLFIVEAMKVMNEVKAPMSGEIMKIHTTDGAMVEFNQVIMELS